MHACRSLFLLPLVLFTHRTKAEGCTVYSCRIWFSYINPIFWTVYGLIITQVGNLDTPCTLADGTVQPVYEAVLTIFGYQ